MDAAVNIKILKIREILHIKYEKITPLDRYL